MAEQGSEQKPPHRSIDMGNDLGSGGMTVQKLKYDTDEIFATEGWRQLTFEEAQQAYKDKGPIFGLYDPMETVYSRGDNASSARIVVKLSGRNRPDDFNHFKTIKYFVEEQ
jgi:hypothetical protein